MLAEPDILSSGLASRSTKILVTDLRPASENSRSEVSGVKSRTADTATSTLGPRFLE